MTEKIINLSRNNKRILMILIDVIALILILIVSFWIRLGFEYYPQSNLLLLILVAPVIAIPILNYFGLYHSIIRYIGFKTLWSIVKAISLYATLWAVLGLFVVIEGEPFVMIPRSVVVINWLLAIIVVGGIRMIARWLLSGFKDTKNKKNIVIYGAGSAGRQLSIALTQSNEYLPVALLDDNCDIQGQTIYGLEVCSPENLASLIKKKNVTEVFLAMPELSRSRRNSIIDFITPYAVIVRSLPSVSELAQGKVKVEDLREINIKDLLGRDPVSPNTKLLKTKINDKSVLVTGAGGSIGSELCRQILLLKPKNLILFDVSESSLYQIEQELLGINSFNIKIFPVIGSVLDRIRMESVFKYFEVDTIYHAAAYKHVPLVEYNQSQGILNNAIGTLLIAETAIIAKVKTFVLISTDKAVRPTNTMGATKRIAELIIQALSKEVNQTSFTMVRFGNVLDSSGSVIPLFKKQIKNGGPLTITDKNIVRYFMTISEAVELVIQAGAMNKGGDLFVLDMGEPVRINDLAKKMIQLSGLKLRNDENPGGDIEIKYVGLRPGEKLYEELLVSGETSKTENPLIMSAQEKMIEWTILKPMLEELIEHANKSDQQKIREMLIKIVPEYSPQSPIVDLLFKK